LLLWLAAAAAMPLAHAAAPNGAADAARADIAAGRYQVAASRGLKQLLAQPWNHELRLLVADSLARSGDAAGAAAQLDALEGTPLAQAARERRLALGTALPAPAPLAAPAPMSDSALASAPVLQLPQLGPAVPVGRLPQFVYVPPGAGVSTAAAAAVDDGRSPAAKAVAALNLAGNYQETGSAGLALMGREKVDPALQLQIANALAWTGRLDEAVQAYKGLLDGEHADAAKVGTANVLRWRGRDAEAAPLYRAVLAKSPADAGAIEGLDLAMRELRPRTTLVLGAQEDSGQMERLSASVQQRWRDGPQAHLVELEAGTVRDSLPSTDADQRELTLRYHAHSLPWTPVFEASAATGAGLFGGVRVKPLGEATVLELARVNWARLANNPNGLQKGLSATLLGAETGRATVAGQVTARVQNYAVSDGNRITTASLRLAAAWRPLGKSIKPFAGIEVRDAAFNTPDYWSPAVGSGVAYAGLQAEAGNSTWNAFASAQAGARLYGDAGTSWSLALGGRRWITSDLAVAFSLWSMASQRDNAAYRAKSGSVSVEKLW
jgi:tetratricopeptide (TPR) repeat protein